MTAGEVLLGVDLGERRIGIALGRAGVATPLTVLRRGRRPAEDHRAISDLVTEWEVDRVVVGWPRDLQGREGIAARQARREARQLSGCLPVPVEIYDERLTTRIAERTLSPLNLDGPTRRTIVDQVAAAVLLQGWIDAAGVEPADRPKSEGIGR